MAIHPVHIQPLLMQQGQISHDNAVAHTQPVEDQRRVAEENKAQAQLDAHRVQAQTQAENLKVNERDQKRREQRRGKRGRPSPAGPEEDHDQSQPKLAEEEFKGVHIDVRQ